jgi:hypothetical protein
MAAVDQLSTWAVLFMVAYVALDVTTHLSRQTLFETMRRLIAVVTLSLIAAYLMEVIFGDVAQGAGAFQGPLLLVVWIPVLLFSLVFSWGLYHRMLGHSQRVQMERVNIVELVAKRVDEVLAPLQKQIIELQEAAKVDKASADERGSKLAAAFQDLKQSVIQNIPTVDSVLDALRRGNWEIEQMLKGYRRWADVHKNDAAIINRVSSNLESLVERAEIVEEELGELSWNPEQESQGLLGADRHKPALPPSATVALDPPHRLTREDGLANREKGNQALMRFHEKLRNLGKNCKVSLLHGAPDLLFLGEDGSVRFIAAYKALTLSEQGSAKQRWIPRAKLVAELRLATKQGKPLILFVENLANGRIWASVIPQDGVKDFRGVTTPLMLVNGDPESEKACSDSLTSVLQLL